MEINNVHIKSMFNLALYYDEIHNYDEMKKYYKMADENGCDDSKNNLEFYYESIKEDSSNIGKK